MRRRYRRRHPEFERLGLRAAAVAWRQVPWFFRILWWASPWAVSLNVVLGVVTGVVPVLEFRISGVLVDSISTMLRQDTPVLGPTLLWIAVLIGIRVVHGGLGAIRNIAGARLRERAGVRLQQLVIERAGTVALEQYEQAEFYDRLQRAQQAATWRSFVIFDNMIRTMEMIVDVVSLLFLLVAAHFSIPIILAVGTVPVIVSHLRRGRETYELHRKQTPVQRRAQYHVEVLTDRQAAKEIRLYGLGQHLTEQWERLANSLRRERLQLTIRQQVRNGLSGIGSVLAYIGTIGILVRLGLLGRLTPGDITAQIQTANRFPDQLARVTQNLSAMFEELLYLSDLREFTELPPETAERLMHDTDKPVTIEFENVSFAYPGGPEVIKNVSFRLNPGEKIALVGINGAGKTTLIKLLLGLYHPTKGRILIDGVDIRQIEPNSLRKKAAAVFQDFLRYQLSARENIGFGRAELITEEERIRHAAEAGGADELVQALPHGYDTILGRHFEGGQDLSGGQWQRLAIARSYFRDAQILVLDEPTAALDPRAELAVFEEFSRLAEGKTAIFVSHRMASARIADRIMVLDNGRLVEFGHHDELLALGGEYARMFTMQARWYVDEEIEASDEPAPQRSYERGAGT